MGFLGDLLKNIFSGTSQISDTKTDSLGFDGTEGVPDMELEKYNKTDAPLANKVSLANCTPSLTQWLTTKNFTKSNRANSSIKYIVIHYTSNKGDTAKANCSYFYNTYRGASAHYFVDENYTYQCVLDNDIAWHCGTTSTYYSTCRNSTSIGIEMCSDYRNGAYYISDETESRTVTLVKSLMEKYNIDVNHVIRHYDVTRKLCPLPWCNDPSLWMAFKNKLAITNNTTGGNTMGRNSAYECVNGMHIMKIPVSDFKIQYWDKPKKTTAIKNYFNCGYFAHDGNGVTYPVANLKCDIYSETLDTNAIGYFTGSCDFGRIVNNKLISETSKVKSDQFGNKKVTTLFVYNKGVAQIEATNFVPSDASYAVSGAPVMIGGKDASYKNDVLGQGWDSSIVYNIWHGFLGLKGDGYIYYIGAKTTTSNLFVSSEMYNKLKPLGFTDVIKVDGGGSYILDVDGQNKAVTDENRRINNVGRCL